MTEPTANLPQTPERYSIDTHADRRQRNALIGLGIGSALVLLMGIVAVLLTRSDGSQDSVSTPTPVTDIADTSPPSSTSSTVATTSTTSTVATTSTLPDPASLIADAGPDLAVDAGGVVTLEAAAITEGADNDDVQWRQIDGPDVTGGVGALGGSTVSFGAPDDVTTLRFELVVDNGELADEPTSADELTVRIFEDADAAVFVDGASGDDAAEGTMEAPLRTIGAATQRNGSDIYVRNTVSYSETQTVRLGPDSSLYGGFDAEWVRDRSLRVSLSGASVAVAIDGPGDRHLESFTITTADAAPGARSIAVRVAGADVVTIADSRIASGRGGDGTGTSDGGFAGASVGVLATDSAEIRIVRSTVNAGSGGDGADGSEGDDGGEDGDDGTDGSGVDAGVGGESDEEEAAGGNGGDGGTSASGDDAEGPRGGSGGVAELDDGQPGDGGDGGVGGAGGNGGDGLLNDDESVPTGATGLSGEDGAVGIGGGGGGGGAAGPGVGLATGGAGGGGGAGGSGGIGAGGGGGGGGSIGLWAVRVDQVTISESLVAAGRGGNGGNGGSGASGVVGGNGGDGAEGGETTAVAGDGGGGGGGGAGGDGGDGGGGAGGPSYGMLTTEVDQLVVEFSTLRGGGGGNGADGGLGGAGGGSGDDGSDRSGGSGGAVASGASALNGDGASGGASFGWFDVGGATQTFNSADFVEGQPGQGGAGAAAGAAGDAGEANVDA